jgi:hypothetical protein
MRRYGMRDDQWERIPDLLPGQEGHVGVTAADNRLFVEAVLYRYRPACRAAIFRSASAIGKTCINASANGRNQGLGEGLPASFR